MNKKGFTLVELLAVIAILAILVIIAMPNVMGMFQGAKKNTFVTETQTIFKSVQTQFVQDAVTGLETPKIIYARSNTAVCTENKANGIRVLDLSGNNKIDYIVRVTSGGEITDFVATDGTYQISLTDANGIKIEDISDTTVEEVAELEAGSKIKYNLTCPTKYDAASLFTKE